MSPLECTMRVLSELECLENMVASIKKKIDKKELRNNSPLVVEMARVVDAMVNGLGEEVKGGAEQANTSHSVHYAKETNGCYKSLHLTMSIRRETISRQMDRGASMSTMAKDIACELELLKDVVREESYKIVSRAIE